MCEEDRIIASIDVYVSELVTMAERSGWELSQESYERIAVDVAQLLRQNDLLAEIIGNTIRTALVTELSRLDREKGVEPNMLRDISR